MKKKLTKKGPLKIANPSGLSTEEEEIKFRKIRGQKETMHIKALKNNPEPFDAYEVQTEAGIPYVVEIRSLNNNLNSCSCPDFLVNTLCTCKHIEGVLHNLLKLHKKPSTPSSPKIEIYLAGTVQPKVSIAWPTPSKIPADVKTTLEPFFSANNTLIADPVIGLASIERTLAEASPHVRDKIRISSHLQTWIKSQKQMQTNQLSREQFLNDVKAGKRSMQMMTVPLYPYQQEGMLHLAFQGRALLADEMGLGKTIQAIAACELLRRLHNIQHVIVISPASLKGEWEEQIAKFTGLPSLIVQGNRADRLAAYQKPSFFYLLNYEQVRSDFEEIQQILSPDVMILDEAQRIKNWQTKTSWAVKQLKTPYAFVLTGTPIENRIDEIFSILQVVDPHVLGPLFKFNRDFFQFNDKGKAIGYKNLDELHRRLKPVLLRRLKKEVEEQLPERTINNLFVEMDSEQAKRYDEYNERVSRLLYVMKKRPLTDDESKKLQKWLACMRMLADTPYILDENCKVCPKLDELKPILAELLEGTTNKIIIFSEWERMLHLVREYVQELNIPFAWHTGTVPQQKRRDDIKRFKEDPSCRVFLTTDSGSTGLNLQVANVVINLDLPWNPAKLEQRIARSWRKNQTRAVQVINFICQDSIEHRMLTMLSQKQSLANGVLDGEGNLSSMALPSARRDVLEQLDILTQTASSDSSEESSQIHVREAHPKGNPLEHIKNDVVAHFNDRIHTLECYHNPSSDTQTLLAVVDQCGQDIKPRIKDFVDKHSEDATSPPQLEVIDQETYALLQRLATAGIISIHANAAEALYRSPIAQRVHQTTKQQHLAKAKKHLAEAEHKMRMSQLLASGGFVLESLPAVIEALELGLKSYVALDDGNHQEGSNFLYKINEDKETYTVEAAKLVIERADRYIQDFAQTITKYALEG